MPAALKRWRTEPLRSKLVLGAGIAVFVLAVGIFLALAVSVTSGRHLERELAILRFFRHADDLSRGLGPPIVGTFVRDLTALGGVAVLTLLVSLVLGFLVLRRRYGAVVLIVAATLSGVMFEGVVKTLVSRDRPQIVAHLMEETSKSFPSGHSMMSSLVYLTLGTLLAQTMARRREKFYIVASAALITLLVGLSRVYLGVHYPTDVMAGWAAGVAWAMMFWGLAWWLQSRGKLRRPPAERGN